MIDATRRSIVALLLVFAAATHLWGIERDLPWAPGGDEVNFTLVSTGIAASGDLNPHWFGHPGTTLIYPYALAIHAVDVLRGDGRWLEADPRLAERIAADPAAYLLVGRAISVAYALLALLLTYAVGSQVFGATTGLIGAWLSLLSPLTLDHALMVRTDGPGLFFGLLGLWLCFALLERPSFVRHVVAGLVIGAAVATRYFLVALLPVLLLVDGMLLRRAVAARKEGIRAAAAGLVAVLVGFAAASPYLVLELGTVVGNLAHEARVRHPGADGLSFAGNLLWYLGDALPEAFPLPWLGLAALGMGGAIVRRQAKPLLLLAFTAIFLFGTSLGPLHWARWLIQILPILALFAASGLVGLVAWATRRAGGGERAASVALAIGLVLVSADPAWRYVRFAARQGQPTTRILARSWMIDNLPAGARVAAELYTAPLQGSPLVADYRPALVEMVASPQVLRAAGYDFAMVSSGAYGRFFAQPDRYAREVAFYGELFRKPLVREFKPGPDARGPVIRVYDLRPQPSGDHHSRRSEPEAADAKTCAVSGAEGSSALSDV